MQTHVEEGGALLWMLVRSRFFLSQGKVYCHRRRSGAFFVHPGGDRGLESKENLLLPLSNHYDEIRSRYPNAVSSLAGTLTLRGTVPSWCGGIRDLESRNGRFSACRESFRYFSGPVF